VAFTSIVREERTKKRERIRKGKKRERMRKGKGL